jgi:pimeloyl-ACP methyl ester carboxylesterase
MPRSPAGSRWAVPFLLSQSETDVITSISLAEYLQEVQAPANELVLSKAAGRFAASTQPDRFVAESIREP